MIKMCLYSTIRRELPLNRLRGFTQKVKEMGLIPKNIVPILERRKADKKLAKLLGIDENCVCPKCGYRK